MNRSASGKSALARKITPSSTMYNELKRLGMSKHESACMLMNTQLTFDGQPLQARIDESSQLTRRIVHTEPGEIPRGLFNNFHVSCPRIARALTERRAIQDCGGDGDKATLSLIDTISTSSSEKMLEALDVWGIDGSIYRNMTFYINHSDLASEKDRLVLYLMMFVATGCLGNPRAASIIVVDYATEILGGDFQTAETVVSAAAQPDELQTEPVLGLVRMTDGKIKAGTRVHVLNPSGTEIGLLPKSRHMIADVEGDVSRRHAFVWRENNQWFIVDLESVNGTRVVSGTSGETIDVPSVAEEEIGSGANDLESGLIGNAAAVNATPIAPTDVLTLGSSTQFIVMPALVD